MSPRRMLPTPSAVLTWAPISVGDQPLPLPGEPPLGFRVGGRLLSRRLLDQGYKEAINAGRGEGHELYGMAARGSEGASVDMGATSADEIGRLALAAGAGHDRATDATTVASDESLLSLLGEQGRGAGRGRQGGAGQGVLEGWGQRLRLLP